MLPQHPFSSKYYTNCKLLTALPSAGYRVKWKSKLFLLTVDKTNSFYKLVQRHYANFSMYT